MLCVMTMIRWRLPRSATVPPIGARRKTGIWLQNAVDAEQGRRAGQAVDQPRLGDRLHPGADERDQLAAEEELVVAMPERAEKVSHGNEASRHVEEC